MSIDKESEDGAGSQDSERHSQITWMRSMGDSAALYQLMDADSNLTQGLEAAEALAELGDVRGLDHLIATLDSQSSYLRHQAAQILKRLNHPRGLRALRDHHDESGGLASPDVSSATRGARREQIYGDLSARGTDELMAMWHENDRAKSPPLALEVIAEILKERLGTLPARSSSGSGRTREDTDEDADPRIRRLWTNGDTGPLTAIMYDESDDALALEAAEALADLGDQDALDLLIELLEDRDSHVREMAAEILDWLDLPRGNEALDAHGLTFEAGPEDLFTRSAEPPVASAPSPPRGSWAAETPSGPASRLPRAQPLQSTSVSPVWQQSDSSLAPLGFLLIGAAGGLFGFLLFRLGLELLRLERLPTDSWWWLRAPALYYLAGSVVVGAVFGAIGGRVAHAIGRRLGWETGESDLLPLFGALLEGATTALILNIALYASRDA